MILGFDQSYTNSGFCVLDGSETRNIIEFGTFKSDAALDIYDRARQISTVFQNLIIKHNIHSVNFEGLAFGIRGDATRDLAGLLFVLITGLRNNNININCRIIAPTSLKKFATGSGKADKAAMISSLSPEILELFKGRYKKTTGLADVCDAFWLACYK
jgi:Holliday junction resolvasome RuvABC endonuclease subunit